MKKYIWMSAIFTLLVLIAGCAQEDPDENLLQFNQKFLGNYVPEFRESRLLNKNDLPPDQQRMFDESEARLQLLVDLNQNTIPDYVISGVCESCLNAEEKMPYYIAIFERQETGIVRQFFQRVYVPPVNFQQSNERGFPSVVISFAFASDYGAEIYFQDNEYHLEIW
ncbi:MAG: hypothetical protein V2J62_06270 [candidate division KSB1 bacterium]|jgi:hypothetical protein|nr:hypothetical protein [candidate division KSB1 bacterium]